MSDPAKPKRRRALRVVAISIGGLLLLVLGFVLFLHSGPGQRWLTERVRSAIARRVDGTVELGRVEARLFGSIAVERLVLKDTSGAPVVSLDALRIEPSWGDLVRGRIVVDDVELRGLSLGIVQHADGSSNLKQLFKPRPASTPSSEQKRSRRIEVRSIRVSGVGLTLEKPDGSKLAVHDVALSGSLDAVASDKTATVLIPELSGSLERSAADGTRISVSELRTGLEVRLVEGAGTAKLLPLSAQLKLERPGHAPFATPVRLGGIETEVAPGELGAALAKLEVGLLVLESLKIEAAYDEGSLSGSQRATLLGLSLDAKRVNALLGKPILSENINIIAKIHGPPDELKVDLSVTSAGARLALGGTLDMTRLDRPSYDLELAGSKIETKKLTPSEKAPDLAIEKLTLGVDGSGVKREDIAADVRLDVGRTRVGRVSIESAKLTARYERGVLTIRELVVDALDQDLRAKGSYVVATKEVDLELTLSGDPSRALAALRRAGVPVKTALPAGFVRLAPGELRLEAKGKLDGDVEVRLPKAKVRVAGGTATVDATLALRDKKLETIDADVRLSKVDLKKLATLRGTALEDVSGSVNGRIKVRGTKRAPRFDADLSIEAEGRRGSKLQVAVKAKGDRGRQHVTVVADRVRGSARDRVLELEADRGRDLSVKLVVPRRRLGEITDLLPNVVRDRVRNLPEDAELEARVDLGGTTAKPRGTWSVALGGELVPFYDARQSIELTGRIEPEGERSHASSTLALSLDSRKPPTVRAEAHARFRKSPLLPGGTRELDWTLVLDLPGTRIEELPLVADRGLAGKIGAHLDLHGTRRDLGGTIGVDVSDFRRGELGPLGAKLVASIGKQRTDVDLSLRAADFEAARARGQLGVVEAGLIEKFRTKSLGDPAVELTLDVPRRSFKEWGKLREKLAELDGAVGGNARVHGTLKQPLLDAELSADGFAMQSGAPGRAALTLSASAERVDAQLGLGPASESPPLTIVAMAPRADLLAMLGAKDETKSVSVELRARADTKLGRVIPVLTPRLGAVRPSGDLDWTMDGKLVLEGRDGKRSLADASLIGALSVSRGELPIPGTARRYRDVELRLTSSSEAIVLERLTARESDHENAARKLSAKGRVAWTRLRPERVRLSFDADDWLLFGGDTLGAPDAPRAALTAKIDVDGAADARRFDVVVQKLDLRMPDRFDKAHWPEKTSLGDVIELSEKGARVGKLPLPPPKPAPAPPPDPRQPVTRIHVAIPNRIHVQKPPFDMIATGELDVAIVSGQRPRVAGELVVHQGHMDLGGRDHRIDQKQKSRIYFDEAHPSGELDLYLALAPHPAVLRDVSRASAGGDDVRIHLAGSIAKPVSTVTGVGNADLWDILPVHNAGRVKFTSQPDMPPSSSPQVPREYDVVLLSYMAANLPHNLILDRMNAWSDPYDGRTSYGQIRHLDAERYSSDGTTRIRVISRPPTMGRSNAELEADWLWLNGPRTKAGVGAVAGSRAGGGPALFFEWSSAD